MEHSFDVEIAAEYGIDEAILLKHIYFWCKQNQANNKHIHNGTAWTYNTSKAFAVIFPYWSAQKIKRILKSLKDNELIQTGNYNDVRFDRTLWYALTPKGYSKFERIDGTELNNLKVQNCTMGGTELNNLKVQNCTTNTICKTDNEDTGIKPNIRENTRAPKRETNTYLEYVKLTEEEYQKLLEKYGRECLEWMLDKLNNYIGTLNGKYNKNHYYTLNGGWVHRAYLEEHTAKRMTQPSKNDGQAALEEVKRRIEERYGRQNQ